MTVAGICCAKNEQDIIEPFVRHNLEHLDSLYIINNGSVDRTGEILSKLQSEFPQLAVAYEPRFGHFQSQWMTELYHQVTGTDCVVPLDADEFLNLEDGPSFSSIPLGGFGIIPSQTFVTYRDSSDPPRDLKLYGNHLWIPRIILRGGIPDLVIGQGSHSAWIMRDGVRSELPQTPLSGILSLHYPVRSMDQFIAKIVTNWMAYLASNPHADTSGMGIHKRDWFARISRETLPTLKEISETYYNDKQSVFLSFSPGFDYQRRYSDGKSLPALQLIARTWEQSICGK